MDHNNSALNIQQITNVSKVLRAPRNVAWNETTPFPHLKLVWLGG